MPKFTFAPLASPKARAYLERRSAHLATLNPPAQRVFLKTSIELMRNAPIGSDVSNFDRHLVVTTLQRWLDETREAA